MEDLNLDAFGIWIGATRHFWPPVISLCELGTSDELACMPCRLVNCGVAVVDKLQLTLSIVLIVQGSEYCKADCRSY